MSSSYPNILTPPSSSGDSPQRLLYTVSPTFPQDSNMTVTQSSFLNFEVSHNIGPYLRIIEEPIDRFRFRYKSEMTGTHGSLSGLNSDKSRKPTYPTVEVVFVFLTIFQIEGDLRSKILGLV